MNSRAAKFVPVGVVACAIGYLCWPYLATPSAPPAPKKTSEREELTAAMLAPPPFSPLERDPFGVLTTDENLTHPSHNAFPAFRAQGSLASAGAVPRHSTAYPADALGGLVLLGTYVRGAHRAALINHSVYTEGDAITLDEQTGAICRVAAINLDKVVLDLNGQMAELSYPDFYSAPELLEQPPIEGEAAAPDAAISNSPTR